MFRNPICDKNRSGHYFFFGLRADPPPPSQCSGSTFRYPLEKKESSHYLAMSFLRAVGTKTLIGMSWHSLLMGLGVAARLGQSDGITVLFHSIRHPAWRVTSLPKFWFRQAPDLNVTSKYLRQVGCKFCVRSLKLVHCQLNCIYYLHNVFKRDRRASGIFFVFLIYFIEFSDDFGTWLKFALPALHFDKFEGCMTHYCGIEWNSTVFHCGPKSTLCFCLIASHASYIPNTLKNTIAIPSKGIESEAT